MKASSRINPFSPRPRGKRAVRLSELLSGADVLGVAGSLDVDITDVVCDSRKASPGCLFFAVPGSRTDGFLFAKQAIEQGAAAVLSERPPGEGTAVWIQARSVLKAMSRVSANFYENPSAGLPVIGVTGTNGKTTTTYFLESILARSGAWVGVLGTVDYRLGGKKVEEAPNTTPVSLDLQRLLRRMRNGGATHVVMEASSHALALNRVDDVAFDAAVFTNLRSDHLDYHKTMEQYLEAKARLFDILCRKENPKSRRVAVLNADEECFPVLKRHVTDAEIITYGRSPDADVRLLAVSALRDGTGLRFMFRDREWPARLGLIGDYNAYNALAAAATALALGQPIETVIQGLETLGGVPGRLEQVPTGRPFSVFVDYAHTESALVLALGCVRKIPHRRIIVVVGCGGDRDRTKRGPMGAAAARLSDLAILTSDNPRSEDPAGILREMEEGIKAQGGKNYKIVPDRGEAVAQAVRAAGEGDIVLIAGKGHETTQILKDGAIPFDDRQAAQDALRRT